MQFTIINLEELSVSEKDKELLKKFKSFGMNPFNLCRKLMRIMMRFQNNL